jgi:WD40 repeat protein
VVKTLPAQKSRATRVAWDPAGQRLAASYEEGRVILWDVLTGDPAQTWDGAQGWNQSLAWTNSGNRLASSGVDGLIRIWDASDGRLVHKLTATKGDVHDYTNPQLSYVNGLSWHPDGVRLASAHRFGHVFVWDANAGLPLFRCSSQGGGELYAIAWRPDGRFLAGGGSGSNTVILDENGVVKAALSGAAAVRCLRWSADGARLIASANYDHSVRVWSWDGVAGELLGAQRLHTGGIDSIAWSPNEDRILSGMFGSQFLSGAVRIHPVLNVIPQATILRLPPQAHPTQVTWSPNGRWLAVSGAHSEIRDARTGAVEHRFQIPATSHSVSWRPDSGALAAGDGRGVWICQIGAAERALPLADPQKGSQTVAWSGDGRWLATADTRGDTLVWDAGSWKLVSKLDQSHPYSVLAWSRDSTRLAVSWNGPDMYLWDLPRRQIIASTKNFHTKDLSWSPDGRMLAVATGQPLILHGRDLTVLHQLTDDNPKVKGIAWSPDGRRLATGGMDGVKIFDTATADLLLSLPCTTTAGEKAAVMSLAWSPDGRRLAAACSDDNVRLWGSADMDALPPGDYLESGVLARAAHDTGPTAVAPLIPEKAESAAEPEAAAEGKGPSAGTFVLLNDTIAVETSYESLTQAIAAAPYGATIEIRGNGPFVTPALDLGERALVLRAGAGFEPVLQLDEASRAAGLPLVATHAALTLEGLHFRHIDEANIKTDSNYLICVRGAPLAATHCRFFAVSNRNFSALWLENSPRAEVRHCEFAGAFMTAVSWTALASSHELELADCLSWGPGHFVVYAHYSPKSPRIALRLEGNTVVGHCAVQHYYQRLPDSVDDPALRPFRIEARSNIFNVGVVFAATVPANGAYQPEVDQPLLRRCLAWSESQNLYTGDLLHVSHNEAKYVSHRAIKNSLEDWQQYWGLNDTGSLHSQRLHFQGGNVRATKTATPEKLTAADFRLDKTSDGRGRGENGRDLGAEVERVGPGPAYDAWRRTADYQARLKTAAPPQ